jgi:3',5'-cyclic AMP phosphodiesterase CpdA
MTRALSVCLLALSLLACYPKGWREQPSFPEADFPFVAGPYLVLVRQGTMAVVVKHPLPEPPTVEWWIEATGTSSAAPVRTMRMAPNEDFWVAVLDDLPLDTGIYYRVRSSVGETRVMRFLAGASRGRKLRFAAFGDTRTGHDVHRSLVEAMSKEEIEFVIHSGDLVEFGGVEEQWDLFFRIEAPLVSQVPMFAAIGNHDNSSRNYFQSYFQTRLYAGGNRYYYQDWGDVRVVIIDSEIEFRPGSDQYQFLENALRGAAANDQLIFMSLHYPPYSSGEHGSYLEARAILAELAPRFGVEVILAGHDHDYERTKAIDGVTYIVAASGGATIRAINPSEFSVVMRTEPHFVLFDVDRHSLVGRAVNLRGDIFDDFVVPPNPVRQP